MFPSFPADLDSTPFFRPAGLEKRKVSSVETISQTPKTTASPPQPFTMLAPDNEPENSGNGGIIVREAMVAYYHSSHPNALPAAPAPPGAGSKSRGRKVLRRTGKKRGAGPVLPMAMGGNLAFGESSGLGVSRVYFPALLCSRTPRPDCEQQCVLGAQREERKGPAGSEVSLSPLSLPSLCPP